MTSADNIVAINLTGSAARRAYKPEKKLTIADLAEVPPWTMSLRAALKSLDAELKRPPKIPVMPLA